MSPSPVSLVVLLLAGLFSACSTPQISRREIKQSDQDALKLVAAAQKASGAEAFREIHIVTVRYEGKWASIGPRFQPVLADTRFRGGSVEVLDLRKHTISQKHTGPAGSKDVLRSRNDVRVLYNGVASSDEEVNHAAALVADAYTMFLLGPFYFDRTGVFLTMDGEDVVDGALCDRVIASLKPGFGVAKEDRVVLSINRATNQLRRIRMTLNGLASTQGAEVDVTFRDFRRIAGVLWPTDFDERIRVPFKLHAHHWRLVDLKAR